MRSGFCRQETAVHLLSCWQCERRNQRNDRWHGSDGRRHRRRRGVPVGGTSAGMNVLTQFVYSALAPQGATSSQSLADPFNRYLTFARDFANVASLVGVIGDPHFVTRDRMGRDLAFLCRVAANGW